MSTTIQTAPAALRGGRSLLRVRGFLGAAAIFISALLLPLAGASAQSGDGSAKGGLFFKTSKPGVYYEAPLVDTDVALAVTGTILRATVRQRFVNPSNAWLEGVYVFPLPEQAAVDHLVMEIGDRNVEGQIKERQEAKARLRAGGGRAASMPAWWRASGPNIFTTSVANIGPGEAITVEIQYQDTVRYRRRHLQPALPDGGGPALHPGRPIARSAIGPAGAGAGQAGPRTPTRCRMPAASRRRCCSRARARSIRSARASTSRRASRRAGQQPLSPGSSRRGSTAGRASRWPTATCRPTATSCWSGRRSRRRRRPRALFAEQRGARRLPVRDVTPPRRATARDAAPAARRRVRDRHFRLHGRDRRSSRPRARCTLALDRLQPDDRFNVIHFNHVTDALFADAQPVDRRHAATAQRFVDALAPPAARRCCRRCSRR